MNTKPTIVLVHRAFADLSSWNEVMSTLLVHGCPVVPVANPLRGVASDAASLLTSYRVYRVLWDEEKQLLDLFMALRLAELIRWYASQDDAASYQTAQAILADGCPILASVVHRFGHSGVANIRLWESGDRFVEASTSQKDVTDV